MAAALISRLGLRYSALETRGVLDHGRKGTRALATQVRFDMTVKTDV
jgi:hypothetical protein